MKRKNKLKIIVIVGPTASGKSNLAVKLAKKFKGEIISADSRQVYEGLNIGTGKITKKEMRGIAHHLLDVANPRRQFSVADYKTEAEESIREILQQNKIPIVCGGSGFYIDTLLGNVSLPEVTANKKLRQKLSKKSVTELFTILKKKDPRRAKEIDRHNPVRLIRAIEIAETLGKVPEIKTKSPFEILKIGTLLGRETLKEKIHTRLLARMKKGMVREAQKLHKEGLSWKRMEALGLEYRYLAKHLKGELSKEEMLKKLETEIWHYAKRQFTWFKRDKKIKWFDPKHTKKIEAEVRKFLKN